LDPSILLKIKYYKRFAQDLEDLNKARFMRKTMVKRSQEIYLTIVFEIRSRKSLVYENSTSDFFSD